jgi:hypothetical protein
MVKCLTCDESADSFYAECKHNVYCINCVKNLTGKKELCNKCPTCMKISSYIHTHCTGKCVNVTTLAILESQQYCSSLCGQCNFGLTDGIVHDDPRTRVEVMHTAIQKIAKPVPDNYMKMMMGMINSSITESQWINAFKECYTIINNEAKKCYTHYLFTTEQIVEIGQIMHKLPLTGKNYQMRNIMIILCLYPWEPPRNLFSHGLCYYGNFGDIPTSAQSAKSLVYGNMALWDRGGFNIGT